MASGADGMFLWAVLMFIYLESPRLAPNPARASSARLKAIKDFRYPEGLDNMYARIIGLIWSGHPYERELARQVFRWIIFRESTISAHQLHDILDFSYEREHGNQSVTHLQTEQHVSRGVEAFNAMENAILMACSSLVVLECQGASQQYSFIHTSAFEFLTERLEKVHPSNGCEAEPIRYFSLCRPESEIRLATDCLDYLAMRIRPGPLSGNILEAAQKEVLHENHPFLAYANIHWASHLSRTLGCHHEDRLSKENALPASVLGFLARQASLMSWVESLYLFGTGPRFFEHLRSCIATRAEQLSQEAPGNRDPGFVGELNHFLDYLTTMENDWGISLRTAPHTIWQDLTAFSPSRFFLQTSAMTVQPITLTETPSNLSSVCLCRISEDLPDGTLMAVLEIWPSK